MWPDHASQLLRSRLLAGRSIVLARAAAREEPGEQPGGAPRGAPGAQGGAALARSLAVACEALAARLTVCALPLGDAHHADTRGGRSAADGGGGELSAIERVIERALAQAGAFDVLALDAASVFAAAGERSPDGSRDAAARVALGACLQSSWEATRAVARGAFLERSRAGRIVIVAPRSRAGRPAELERAARAARAGLENLARTLSIEWSRHEVTTVVLAPGEDTSADQLATLIAYLASPAGAYFSGCVFDLTGPRADAGAG